MSANRVLQQMSQQKEEQAMRKQETKGGNGKAPLQTVGSEAEVYVWFVGKSLLNGGKKLKPELEELLNQLGVKVSSIVTDHGSEPPMVCLKGEKETINALTAIAKAKAA